MNFSLYHITRPSILKENAPLLIMLHGYGSDENDLFSFANELPEELFIISVRAPHPLPQEIQTTVSLPGMPFILMLRKINGTIQSKLWSPVI